MSSPARSLLGTVLGCRGALHIRGLAQQQRLEQRIGAGRVPDQHTLQADEPTAAGQSTSIAPNRGGGRKLMPRGSIQYSLVHQILVLAAAASLCCVSTAARAEWSVAASNTSLKQTNPVLLQCPVGLVLTL